MTEITGTCQSCGHRIPWRVSTLDRHRTDGGTTGRIPKVDQCSGSYRPPVEALGPHRSMTKAERDLSREMFG